MSSEPLSLWESFFFSLFFHTSNLVYCLFNICLIVLVLLPPTILPGVTEVRCSSIWQICLKILILFLLFYNQWKIVVLDLKICYTHFFLKIESIVIKDKGRKQYDHSNNFSFNSFCHTTIAFTSVLKVILVYQVLTAFIL